jgi:asparagine synthase (glutamine-hydrolysing)
MCGIVGTCGYRGESVSRDLLEKMTTALAHRGPDGEGCYVDGPVGLGHRRLAILDLSPAGHQPMVGHDRNLIITYNGEIYNFKELRSELESLGHRFKSKTDTEVVLNAYEQWGAECLDRFNGMFAFAILDRQKKSLFIARDRYGIKPLYYCFFNNTFLFASEQKALLVHPDLPREIDLEALMEYFTFQNLFTDKTLFRSVKLFPPGSWARVSTEENPGELKPVKYWDYSFREPDHARSEGEYLEELDCLFRRAVKRQLVSDVDVGSYLSGGMDSGSITAISATELPYIKTFTCGFDLHSASGLEMAYDEREKAEFMSYVFKTEHYEMVLKAGDMERVLPQLAWHLEEPRVGQSYPNYYAAQLASKFVKVVLAGTGGDELFGGYPWRYYRAVVNEDFNQYLDKYYLYWQRLIPNKSIQRVFGPVWDQVKHVWTRDIFGGVFPPGSEKLTTPEDYVNQSLYFEAKTFLHGLLIVEDKLSMAHGLETRVPFLDNDLVDFAMQIPVKHKLQSLQDVVRLNENEPGPKTKKFFSKCRDGKLLLRKAMERHIPSEISEAVKQGFSAPDASWFRGESIDYLRRVIYDDHSRIYEFLDKKAVREMIDDHLQERCNRRLYIWSLLNFEWFLRQFS